MTPRISVVSVIESTTTVFTHCFKPSSITVTASKGLAADFFYSRHHHDVV